MRKVKEMGKVREIKAFHFSYEKLDTLIIFQLIALS